MKNMGEKIINRIWKVAGTQKQIAGGPEQERFVWPSFVVEFRVEWTFMSLGSGPEIVTSTTCCIVEMAHPI